MREKDGTVYRYTGVPLYTCVRFSRENVACDIVSRDQKIEISECQDRPDLDGKARKSVVDESGSKIIPFYSRTVEPQTFDHFALRKVKQDWKVNDNVMVNREGKYYTGIVKQVDTVLRFVSVQTVRGETLNDIGYNNVTRVNKLSRFEAGDTVVFRKPFRKKDGILKPAFTENKFDAVKNEGTKIRPTYYLQCFRVESIVYAKSGFTYAIKKIKQKKEEPGAELYVAQDALAFYSTLTETYGPPQQPRFIKKQGNLFLISENELSENAKKAVKEINMTEKVVTQWDA